MSNSTNIFVGEPFYRPITQQGSAIEHLAFEEGIQAAWEVVTSFKEVKESEKRAFDRDKFEFRFLIEQGIPFFCYRGLRLLKSKGFGATEAKVTIEWQEMPFHLKLTANPDLSERVISRQIYEAEEAWHHTIRLFFIEFSGNQPVKSIRYFTLSPKWWSKVCSSLIEHKDSIRLHDYDVTLAKIYRKYPLGRLPEKHYDPELTTFSGD